MADKMDRIAYRIIIRYGVQNPESQRSSLPQNKESEPRSSENQPDLAIIIFTAKKGFKILGALQTARTQHHSGLLYLITGNTDTRGSENQPDLAITMFTAKNGL